MELCNRKKCYWIALSSFLFYFWIMYCSPITSDDVYFASIDVPSFSSVLDYVLYYGNGRILGNISAILLTRTAFLRPIAKALMLVLIVLLVPALLGLKKHTALLLSFILFTVINPGLFSEVYVWTAGFSNYIPPICLSLVCMYLIQRYPKLQRRWTRRLVNVGVFVLGILSQLFVEHSTVIQLLLACAVLANSVYAREKTVIPGIWWLLGTAAGLCIMFLTPVVFEKAQSRVEGYRSVHVGSILILLRSALDNTLRICSHYAGACGLVLSVGAGLTLVTTKKQHAPRRFAVMAWTCAASLAYMVVCIFVSVDQWFGRPALLLHLLSIPAVLAPLGVWVLAAVKLPSGGKKVVFFLLFAVLSVAPFLIVSPVPARVIFQSYVFIVGALLVCTQECGVSFEKSMENVIRKAVFVTALTLELVLGVTFATIRGMDEARTQYIREQIDLGAEQIDIFQMPMEYVYDENWAYGMIYYQEKMYDVKFSVLAYDEWCGLHMESSKNNS